MLLKAIISNATTDKDYKKVLKKRIYLFYIMMALGTITLALSIIFSTGSHAYLSAFLSGVYSGVGSALIALSVIFIIKTRKILKDEIKLKQKRLEEQDERNQMITQKAIYSAAIILNILVYIGLMIAGIFNLVVFWTLWIVLVVFMLTFIILQVYYRKKL
jgi:tellurite resistance protein TehA-like permease